MSGQHTSARRLLRHVARLAALCALLAGALPAQPTTVTGTLRFVWGDPREDASAPRYRALVTTATDDAYELDLTTADRTVVADAMQLAGRGVTVRLEGGAVRSADVAPGAPPMLGRVQSIVALAGAASPPVAAPAEAPAWAVTTRRYAVLLCKFADSDSEPKPAARYREWYSSQPGAVNDWYGQVSDGRLSVAGTTVHGWYRMAKPRSAYVVNNSANLTALQQDCVAAADADVDFRQYAGLAMHFNTTLDCCSWGGSSRLVADGASVTIPTVWLASWVATGTILHEIGHSFGLPHAGGPYGHTYDSRWDVMSGAGGGVYVNADFGYAGAHFIGWHKDRLGLIPRARKVEVASGTYRGVLLPHALAPPGPDPTYLFVPIAGRPGYGFSVEVRRREGYDRAIPGKAVVIHSIVPGRAEPAWVVDADGNGNPNDAGAMWTVGETFEDPATGIRVEVDSLAGDGFGVTVTNGAGPAPVLERAGVTIERDWGDTVWTRDSVRVLRGRWTARRVFRASWLRVDRTSGGPGDYLVYATLASQVGLGRGLDTVRVEDANGSGAGVGFVVELGATGAVAAPRLARSGSHRILPPNFGYCDSLAILLPAGDGATTAWTAERTARVQFPQAPTGCSTAGALARVTGAGTATLRFYHYTPPTAGMLYVDSVRVTVAGLAAPFVYVDTSEAVARPTVTLSRPGGARPALLGEMLPADSVTVTIGSVAPPGGWTATQRRASTRLFATRGVSGDRIVWSAVPTTAGTIVDSLYACESAFQLYCNLYVDTLRVADAPMQLRVRRPPGPRPPLVRGTAMRQDSASVELLGSLAARKTWYAVSSSFRIEFNSADAFHASASNTGTAWLVWSRDVSGLAPGTYVDTITVVADGVPGSPAVVVDTLVLTAGPAVVGDVNHDGTINAADALLVLRALVGLPLPANAIVQPFGDANCDGTSTAADALLILQNDVGVPASGSCLGRRVPPPQPP